MNLMQFRIHLAELIENTEFSGKAGFVGGAVRDMLLQREATDLDILVELPDGGINLAWHIYNTAGGQRPLVFRQFGTARMVYRGVEMEFVMTRKETYRPGNRNPKVSFGSLQDDVMRRDFTVNSIILGISGGSLLDLSKQGFADLQAGLVRSLGDAEQKFTEDPVRMLRAIRYAVQLGFTIEETTLQALKAEASLLNSLSERRLEDELCRIMLTKPPRTPGATVNQEACPGYDLLMETGLADQLSDEIQKRLANLSKNKFSLTSRDLNRQFGDMSASDIRKMMKSSQRSWFCNPEATTDELMKILVEKYG